MQKSNLLLIWKLGLSLFGYSLFLSLQINLRKISQNMKLHHPPMSINSTMNCMVYRNHSPLKKNRIQRIRTFQAANLTDSMTEQISVMNTNYKGCP